MEDTTAQTEHAISVLLVEDSKTYAAYIDEVLSSSNIDYRITHVTSLAACFEVLRKGGIDIVLLDLELPDSSGFSTFETLHTAFLYQTVVVITGQAEESLAIRTVRSGADDYLVKREVTPQAILRVIRYALERQMATDAIIKSEEKFRNIVAQSSDGIALIDEEGKVIEWNEALAAIYGMTKEDVLYRFIWDVQTDVSVLPKEQSAERTEKLKRMVLTAIDNREAAWFNKPSEQTIHAKDGVTRVVESVIFPIIGNTSILLASNIRDVTEQRREQESARFLSSIVESAEDAIIGKTTEGIIRSWNKGAERMYGYTKGEAIGKHVSMLCAEGCGDEKHSLIARVAKGETISGYETKRMRKDGTIFDALLILSPIRNDANEIVGISAIARDITLQNEAKRKLREALFKSSRKTEETKLLYEAARTVLKTENFEAAAKTIYYACRRAIGATEGYVALLEKGKGENEVLFLDADEATCSVDPSLPMPIRGLRKVAYDAKHAVYENAYPHSSHTQYMPEGHVPLENALFAPLVIDDEALGLLGYANKPGGFTDDDARIAQAVADMLALALRNENTLRTLAASEANVKRYSQELEKELSEKEESIIRAQELQKGLNPKTLPVVKGIAAAAMYMPCEELGGDFFDVRAFNNMVIVIVADCMGHGIDASMHATLLKAISDRHIESLEWKRPDRFLEWVNRDFRRYTTAPNFPTMFACVIEPQNGLITYANANAEFPYLIRHNRAYLLESTAGRHIGHKEQPAFEARTVSFIKDDILCIYSDALVEIQRDNSILFTREEIERHLAGFGRGVTHDMMGLLEEVEAVHPFPLEDDMTLLVIENVTPIADQHRIRTRDEIPFVQDQLLYALSRCNYSIEDRDYIKVGLEEMAVNAITHGNKHNSEKYVTIDWEVMPECVRITIEDEGEGFDPYAVPDPTDIARLLDLFHNNEVEVFTHGRGIWMTREYVDEVTYNEKGNKVSIVKYATPVQTEFRYFERLSRVKRDVEMCVENERIIWTKDIDSGKVIDEGEEHIVIDFKNMQVLASSDIGKLFVIIQHVESTSKALTLYFHDKKMNELVRKLRLAEIENITIVFEPSESEGEF